MNTGKLGTELRMAQWAQEIQNCKSSGESIKDYCRNRKLSKDSYFYWQRKLREAACERLVEVQSERNSMNLPALRFTEVKLQEASVQATSPAPGHSSGKIHIKISGIQMAADAGYPTDRLASLLRELVRQC